MSTLMQIHLISVLSFIIPVVIYLICSKLLKKPLLNIPVFIVLLLALMVWQTFGYDIKSGNEIEFFKDIYRFFHYESVIIVIVEWVPAVVGAVIVNVIGVVKRAKK